MSAPERIHAWPDKTPGVGWHLAHASKTIIGPVGAAEYILFDTVADMIRQAVEQEREACAQEVEDWFYNPETDVVTDRRLADVIRARGDASCG